MFGNHCCKLLVKTQPVDSHEIGIYGSYTGYLASKTKLHTINHFSHSLSMKRHLFTGKYLAPRRAGDTDELTGHDLVIVEAGDDEMGFIILASLLK